MVCRFFEEFRGRHIECQGGGSGGRRPRAAGGGREAECGPAFAGFLLKRVLQERQQERAGTFLFSGVFCFSFSGVMSYKSIYYSMCSVFKCNLRKKKGRKMKKKTMEFELMHDYCAGGAGGRSEPQESVSHACVSCRVQSGLLRCSVLVSPFLRICVQRREGARPRAGGKGEEAADPQAPVPTSRCPHAACPCQPTGGSWASCSWVLGARGCLCHLGPPPPTRLVSR